MTPEISEITGTALEALAQTMVKSAVLELAVDYMTKATILLEVISDPGSVTYDLKRNVGTLAIEATKSKQRGE